MLTRDTMVDGKYWIMDKVGKGGMSTVYRALDQSTGRTWAIKEVRRGRNHSSEIVWQSLLTEINLLKKLSHKNMPRIADVIDYGDTYLIVMDYIEGVTLEQVVRERGAQSEKDVVGWMLKIAEVIEYLHAQKPSIIYRDMKPSNIMLKNDGDVVLIDFGTAREYKDEAIGDTIYLGTRGYAAPEQFGGKGQTDARTDIYCLGVTMFHLLTGCDPCRMSCGTYSVTGLNPSVSKELEAIIGKCIQEDPADRFQSVKELIYALRTYRECTEPRLKQYRKAVALFNTGIAMTLGCVGMSVVTGIEHMPGCSLLFLFYASTMHVLTLCMQSMFDISRLVYILKNKNEIWQSTLNCKSNETGNKSILLKQAVTSLFAVICAWGIYPIKSYAFGSYAASGMNNKANAVYVIAMAFALAILAVIIMTIRLYLAIDTKEKASS